MQACKKMFRFLSALMAAIRRVYPYLWRASAEAIFGRTSNCEENYKKCIINLIHTEMYAVRFTEQSIVQRKLILSLTQATFEAVKQTKQCYF